MTGVISAILWLFFSSAGQQTFSNNEHVSVELTSPAALSASRVGELSFILTPIDGIHINTTPQFELQLEKKSAFEVIGNPKFQKNEKEYLDSFQPVVFSIKAKKNSSSGKQFLKGKLNYFYCSDKEGWCNRFSQPVEITIEISK